MNKSKIGFGGWFLIVFVVVIGALLWTANSTKDTKLGQETASTSRAVALLCTTDMATTYHIHPELTITINGEQQPIPANIGIQPTCMNSIHTHDDTGVIHVEAPVQKDFILADFFAVWQKDFSKDKILTTVVTPQTEIVMTVNGKKVETYENTILRDKDKIVIAYQNK